MKRRASAPPPHSQPAKKIKLDSNSDTTPHLWPLSLTFPQTPFRELDLSGSELRSVSLVSKLQLGQLRSLNLDRNKLVGLKGLEKCNFSLLEVAYLRFNLLKENEPWHLYWFPKLIYLYLNDNHLTCVRTNKLRLSCRRLCHVELNGNPLIKQKWDFDHFRKRIY